MTRLRSLTAIITLLAIVAVIGVVGWRSMPTANAQEAQDEMDVDRLWRDINFLDMLRRTQVTAEQRKDAAQAAKIFQEEHKAVIALAQPDELKLALRDVRSALLAGSEPTAAEQQAVDAAYPADDGAADKAFAQARQEYMTTMQAVLSAEQQAQLAMRPTVEAANGILRMAVDSHDVPAAEREEWRKHSFPELREELADAAGDDAGIVLADLQARIDHLFTLTPQQIDAQHDELMGQLITTLNSAIGGNPEMIRDRLTDELMRWAMEPGLSDLLAESAAAMEQ